MEKYKIGVKKGILPIIFLYTMQEDKNKNHELKEKRVFESKAFNNRSIPLQINERALITNSENYDLYS